ncbi:MAG: HrpE/YscL family type III secretion apparatus protein [Simkaniaceae bacterium]|nr:HrpE/YscL family type III secretion apparatus protein [Simkaniaceae bacterium]
MTLFSLFNESKIQYAAGKKIIPKEEFAELMTASDLIKQAQESAIQYRQDVEDECTLIKKEAENAGFEKGLANLFENIEQVNQHLVQMRHEVQNQILPLVLKAAKKVVGEQLTLQPNVIVDIVMNTLKPVVQCFTVRILVNKADKPFLEERKDQIKLLLERVEHFSIEERHDITPGGCIIETESGIINATLENVWRALEGAFAKFLS